MQNYSRQYESIYLSKEEDILTFACGHQVKRIPFREIIRLQACGSYTSMFTINRKYTFSRHLCYIENKYFKNRKEFFKVHESHILNRNHLLYFEKGVCYLSDGSAIHIAKRRITSLKKALHPLCEKKQFLPVYQK